MLYEVSWDKIDEVAEISADAFIGARCPMGTFVFQNEPDPHVLKRKLYRSLVTACSKKVVIHGTSPGLEAVSIWYPPGVDHSEDADPDPFSSEEFTDPETMERLQAVNDVIEALTGDLGEELQWHLHLVIVRPEFAGRGYASLLVRPMLVRAARVGIPCTLITQTMENVHKYERWGFRVVKEMAAPGSQEKFCSMKKD